MGDADPGRLEKHSLRVAGHATSITLERIFWDHLRRIAARQNRSLAALVTEIDAGRSGNLSSAIRVYVLSQITSD